MLMTKLQAIKRVARLLLKAVQKVLDVLLQSKMVLPISKNPSTSTSSARLIKSDKY